MDKKTDNLKIDINTINPYTNTLLWNYLYFTDLKQQGKTIYLNKKGKKRNLQLKIDNLKRRILKNKNE